MTHGPGFIWRLLAGVSVAGMGLSGWMQSGALAAASAAGLVYVLWRATRDSAPPAAVGSLPPSGESAAPVRRVPREANNIEDLVEEMLAQGRYAILLRPQVAKGLTEAQFTRARQTLEEAMGLVPDGEVALGAIDEVLADGRLSDEELLAARARVVRVDHFFLDRYPVTNRQFFEFVAAGGYEQIALWDESIWPAVLQFVDRTSMPGPAYWQNGSFEPGKDDHPVVGVSWYEAAAYARWVGKRLPSDAEWVKAGSWPVQLSATKRVQRRYPWGDNMDRKRTNLWGTGTGGTSAVTAFPDGVSVGGVYDLIGNVWEWTRGDFRGYGEDDLVLDVPMKSVRGGAFDSYFDNQATCHFQSGENPISRKPNIGFRCALGVCDLLLNWVPPVAEEAGAETEDESLEEVVV